MKRHLSSIGPYRSLAIILLCALAGACNVTTANPVGGGGSGSSGSLDPVDQILNGLAREGSETYWTMELGFTLGASSSVEWAFFANQTGVMRQASVAPHGIGFSWTPEGPDGLTVNLSTTCGHEPQVCWQPYTRFTFIRGGVGEGSFSADLNGRDGPAIFILQSGSL